MLSMLSTVKFVALGAIMFILFPNLDWRWYLLLVAYAIWMICDDREKSTKRDQALEQATHKIMARVDDLQRTLEQALSRQTELSSQTERDIQGRASRVDDMQKQLGEAEATVDELALDRD